MTTHAQPTPTDQAPDTEYAFLVPGLITVYVNAPTEAAARNELALEGADTIELHDPHLTVGRLTITALDLVPASAKLDKINDTLIVDSLPDADFHISDIARVAVRILNESASTHCDRVRRNARGRRLPGEQDPRHRHLHPLRGRRDPPAPARAVG